MANILKIPANSQAYLTTIHDAAQDKFDVIGFEYDYLNTSFPAAWAYWKMEEVSGTRVDASGSGNDLLEIDNTVGNASGILGNAAEFPGTNGTLQNLSTVDKSPDLSGDKKFTITFWARVHRTGAGSANIYYQCNTSTHGCEGAISLGGGQTSAYIYVQTAYRYAESAAVITLDVLHFFSIYYDQTGLYVEMDGVEIASDLGSSGITLTTGAVDWGGIYDDNIMSVRIDEFGIWPDASFLTVDQRAQLYNGGAGWSPY